MGWGQILLSIKILMKLDHNDHVGMGIRNYVEECPDSTFKSFKKSLNDFSSESSVKILMKLDMHNDQLLVSYGSKSWDANKCNAQKVT